jgi:hypothetical protein
VVSNMQGHTCEAESSCAGVCADGMHAQAWLQPFADELLVVGWGRGCWVSNMRGHMRGRMQLCWCADGMHAQGAACDTLSRLPTVERVLPHLDELCEHQQVAVHGCQVAWGVACCILC